MTRAGPEHAVAPVQPWELSARHPLQRGHMLLSFPLCPPNAFLATSRERMEKRFFFFAFIADVGRFSCGTSYC